MLQSQRRTRQHRIPELQVGRAAAVSRGPAPCDSDACYIYSAWLGQAKLINSFSGPPASNFEKAGLFLFIFHVSSHVLINSINRQKLEHTVKSS